MADVIDWAKKPGRAAGEPRAKPLHRRAAGETLVADGMHAAAGWDRLKRIRGGVAFDSAIVLWEQADAMLADVDQLRANLGGSETAIRQLESAVEGLEADNTRHRGLNAELSAACERGLGFVRYALEFFDWSRFPALEAETERTRDAMAAAVAKATGGPPRD